jgi:hypothetical protein
MPESSAISAIHRNRPWFPFRKTHIRVEFEATYGEFARALSSCPSCSSWWSIWSGIRNRFTTKDTKSTKGKTGPEFRFAKCTFASMPQSLAAISGLAFVSFVVFVVNRIFRIPTRNSPRRTRRARRENPDRNSVSQNEVKSIYINILRRFGIFPGRPGMRPVACQPLPDGRSRSPAWFPRVVRTLPGVSIDRFMVEYGLPFVQASKVSWHPTYLSSSTFDRMTEQSPMPHQGCPPQCFADGSRFVNSPHSA